jgi:hypothetical protein
MKRQLKNLRVEWISLVKRPATGKSWVLKGGKVFEIRKTDDELRRAYGIVYAPEQEDLQGDMTDAATIRKAADDFLKSGRVGKVDVSHSFAAVEAFVAESWLVRKGDPLFPGEPEGAWAVGVQVESDRLWKEIKAGDYTGLSLAGVAQTEPRKEETPGWFKKWISGEKKEQNMDLKGLEKLEKELAETRARLDALTAKLEKDQAGDKDSAAKEAMLKEVRVMVDQAIADAKIEQLRDLNKTLAEAFVKGKDQTAGGVKSVWAEMV